VEYLIVSALVAASAFFVWLTNRRGELPQSLRVVGSTGRALTVIGQEGRIEVLGEVWAATSKQGLVDQGNRVLVVGIQPGMILEVESIKEK
jgi:membrane protein implicated in regulation of membrane protease activity